MWMTLAAPFVDVDKVDSYCVHSRLANGRSELKSRDECSDSGATRIVCRLIVVVYQETLPQKTPSSRVGDIL